MKTGIVERWDKLPADVKEHVRRNAVSLLASGQITTDELKKIGIKIADTAEGVGKSVQNTMQDTAVYTTQNITNAVNNSGGGSGGAPNRMMDEAAQDSIAIGNVLVAAH